MRRFDEVHTSGELVSLVERIGFLPFFRCPIPGFSLAECTPPELWFTEKEGPWEWKGQAARTKRVCYGKFFRGKAVYVSLEWLPDFLNYRRDGYDFDALWDDELVSAREKFLYDTVSEHGSILSGDLKKECNYRKDGNKGFDTLITRLQMRGYVAVEDFPYAKDKAGNAYGWGIARYATPEHIFGPDLVRSAYSRDPAESMARIVGHLGSILPDVGEKAILSLLKF